MRGSLLALALAACLPSTGCTGTIGDPRLIDGGSGGGDGGGGGNADAAPPGTPDAAQPDAGPTSCSDTGGTRLEQVCRRWVCDTADLGEGTWSGSTATCDPGDISAGGRANALKLVNLYR